MMASDGSCNVPMVGASGNCGCVRGNVLLAWEW